MDNLDGKSGTEFEPKQIFQKTKGAKQDSIGEHPRITFFKVRLCR